MSVNIYSKWYHDSQIKEDLERKLREVEANGGDAKPVIIGETGTGAIYGFHDPLGHAKWSEERQCDILNEQITAILSDPNIAGVFLWQFADVRVDEEWAMQRPGTRNNKGILNSNRQPKLAYQTVKGLFEH